jgi:predicted nicotinamide N-methyase
MDPGQRRTRVLIEPLPATIQINTWTRVQLRLVDEWWRPVSLAHALSKEALEIESGWKLSLVISCVHESTLLDSKELNVRTRSLPSSISIHSSEHDSFHSFDEHGKCTFEISFIQVDNRNIKISLHVQPILCRALCDIKVSLETSPCKNTFGALSSAFNFLVHLASPALEQSSLSVPPHSGLEPRFALSMDSLLGYQSSEGLLAEHRLALQYPAQPLLLSHQEANPPLVISQLHFDETASCYERSIGSRVWDSTFVLATYLKSPALHAHRVTGRVVLELGAGTGALGLWCRSLGASLVIVTDLPSMVPLMLANASSNCARQLWAEDSVEARPLVWGDFSRKAFPRVDVLLAADVAYQLDCLVPFLTTAWELTDACSVILLGLKFRPGLLEFLAYARSLFVVEIHDDGDIKIYGLSKRTDVGLEALVAMVAEEKAAADARKKAYELTESESESLDGEVFDESDGMTAEALTNYTQPVTFYSIPDKN